MAGINIRNVNVLNNPAKFTDPFKFEIQYEASQALEEDLEWKVTYLSTSDDVSLDQELESVLVGPITPGAYKFVLEVDAPDGTKIPLDDVTGNAGVVVSCLFNEQEFLRIGFYIHVDYEDIELRDNPPETPLFDKLIRNVATDDPRVTTKPLEFKVKEEEEEEVVATPMDEAKLSKPEEANLAEPIGRRRRSPLSLRGSVDFGGSDTASDASSWYKGPSFASTDNLHQAALSLQSTLKGFGITGRFNFLTGAPDDVANTLNCVHHLLQKLQHEQLLREDTQSEHRRIKTDLQNNEATLHQLRKTIEVKERDIETLKIRGRQAHAHHEEELSILIRDRDNLQKQCNNLSRQQIQFQHEIRRKELEYEWLQEKLRKYLADRKRDSATSMEIVGRFRQQNAVPSSDRGKIASKIDEFVSGRNTPVKKMNRAPKLDETMVKMIVTAYEEKQKELTAENKDLQEALNSIRKEYADLMNAQLQGTESNSRLNITRSDSNLAKIYVTMHDRVMEHEENEKSQPNTRRPSSRSAPQQGTEESDSSPPILQTSMMPTAVKESFKFRSPSAPFSEERHDSSNFTIPIKSDEEQILEEGCLDTQQRQQQQQRQIQQQPQQQEEVSLLVPWPMNSESPLRRQNSSEMSEKVDSIGESIAPAESGNVDNGDSSSKPIEQSETRPVNVENGEKVLSLPTVQEEKDLEEFVQETPRNDVKDMEDVTKTDTELSTKSYPKELPLPELIKDEDDLNETSMVSELASPAIPESVFLSQPPLNQDEDSTEDLLSSKASDTKLEETHSVESRVSVKPSPFDLTGNVDGTSGGVAAMAARFGVPPSSVSAPAQLKENTSPRRRMRTIKLPEPSTKPVPNAALLSEEQLRKELRTRAVDVEEAVRALKSACSSMKPQDMKTVMERRLYMEFTMAANLAEQQEAVVNLAVAGLEKAKRLGPVSESDWGVAAQAVTNSVESSEDLMTQMNVMLSSGDKTDTDQLINIMERFQSHLQDIKQEIQVAKERTQEKISKSLERLDSASSTSQSLERNITKLRERAESLTKRQDKLQEIENEGKSSTISDGSQNTSAPPSRETWASRAQKEKRQQGTNPMTTTAAAANVGEEKQSEGDYSDNEESGNLGEILRSEKP